MRFAFPAVPTSCSSRACGRAEHGAWRTQAGRSWIAPSASSRPRRRGVKFLHCRDFPCLAHTLLCLAEGPGQAGQGRAGPGQAGQGRAGPGQAGQGRVRALKRAPVQNVSLEEKCLALFSPRRRSSETPAPGGGWFTCATAAASTLVGSTTSRQAMSALWMHGGSGADHLVTYRAMPAEELRGGEQCAGKADFDSATAKVIAERIVKSLRATDEFEGTNYATNLDDKIFTSDEAKWCRARRELIEKAAVHDQGARYGCGRGSGPSYSPVGSSPRAYGPYGGSSMGGPSMGGPSMGGGGLAGGDGRRVQFAERRDVVDFHQDAPVVSGGSVELRGVLLDAVAPVVFAAGASNCKSNPGFRWKPGGSGGPDGMGYCPQDYEPGTVLPGFDGGLYKVAVGLDGTRVWTSAGDAPITYRVVQRPKGADGMGLLDGVGLGDYDTYSWPAHVPRAWTSYGYRRNCNAYSFLPNHMHHSILRYLVDGRLDRSGSAAGSSTGAGVGEAVAKALLADFGKQALALVVGSAGVMFNKDRAYVGGLKPATTAPAAPAAAAPAATTAAAAAATTAAAAAATTAAAAGTTSGPTAAAAAAAASGAAAAAPASSAATTYEPDGPGILAAGNVWFVGAFTKASKWAELAGGATWFTGWKLEVATGAKVTATHGTADDGSFTASTPERKVEVGSNTDMKSDAKVDGVTVDEAAQTAYFASDKSGYAFELRRLKQAATGTSGQNIWLRIGKCGTKAVQEGWLCKVSVDGKESDTGVAVKFKLDGSGQTQVTHLYAGKVDAFGMPSGLGVLQQVGASNVASTEQCGEFRLGRLVLGACGAQQQGFFLDGALYGDAKFRDAVYIQAREKAAEAKKNVAGKKDELKKGLPEFNAAVNPVNLLLLEGGARAASRRPVTRPVTHVGAYRSPRDAPVPQDDLAMFSGGLKTLPVEVKRAAAAAATGMPIVGGMHLATTGGPAQGQAHAPVHAQQPHPSAQEAHGAQAKPGGPVARAAAPELQKGQVGPEMSRRVQKAQERLRGVRTDGADAQLVAQLQGYAELLFKNGELFVTMEDGLPPVATAAAAEDAEDAEKRKADVLVLIRDVVQPCATLVRHKDAPHDWVRQYVHMLSLKILALVQYICSSERPGVAELCRIRESVEQCLAFALQ